jgi:hypothetical protein
MRRFRVPLALLAAVLLAAGNVWAFVERAESVHPGVTALLGLGSLLGLVVVLEWVGSERRPNGLVVPAEMELPAPAWWGPVIAIGVPSLVGGLLASIPMAVVGGLLVVAGLVGWAVGVARPIPLPDRATVVAARRIQRFGVRHGTSENASPTAAPEHVGRDAVRLVLVGADGVFGDVVIRGAARAATAVALAGAATEDASDRELTARISTGPYEWRRMAGLQLGGRR